MLLPAPVNGWAPRDRTRCASRDCRCPGRHWRVRISCRFAEAITIAVGDADLVRVAQFVLVDAGHMAALDEVRHAANHVPGTHEALQVDRRIRVGDAGAGTRWRLAGGHGGPARDRAKSMAQSGGSKSCGSGLRRALREHGRLSVRDPSMVSQPLRRALTKLCCTVYRRSPMNARSVRRPAAERVSLERADPRCCAACGSWPWPVWHWSWSGRPRVVAARGWAGCRCGWWACRWWPGGRCCAPLPRLSWLRRARHTGGQADRRGGGAARRRRGATAAA